MGGTVTGCFRTCDVIPATVRGDLRLPIVNLFGELEVFRAVARAVDIPGDLGGDGACWMAALMMVASSSGYMDLT